MTDTTTQAAPFAPIHDPSVRGFASDNYAGIHPEVLAALVAANGGHQVAYGEDDYTARLQEVMREALKTLPKIGPTIASKLVARKRPRLFPIIDSDLRRTVFHETRKDGYVGRALLHAEFSAQERTIWQRLESYRCAAALPAEVTTLRVFDVLAWMEAKAY